MYALTNVYALDICPDMSARCCVRLYVCVRVSSSYLFIACKHILVLKCTWMPASDQSYSCPSSEFYLWPKHFFRLALTPSVMFKNLGQMFLHAECTQSSAQRRQTPMATCRKAHTCSHGTWTSEPACRAAGAHNKSGGRRPSAHYTKSRSETRVV